jgi:hypothetical protein
MTTAENALILQILQLCSIFDIVDLSYMASSSVPFGLRQLHPLLSVKFCDAFFVSNVDMASGDLWDAYWSIELKRLSILFCGLEIRAPRLKIWYWKPF